MDTNISRRFGDNKLGKLAEEHYKHEYEVDFQTIPSALGLTSNLA